MVQVPSLLAAFVALAPLAVTAFPFPDFTRTKAVYFQTNKSPNSIVAVNVGSGGKIRGATFHATGGVGSAELALTGPHLPDSLGSQNSVAVYGNVSTLLLYRICQTDLFSISSTSTRGQIKSLFSLSHPRIRRGLSELAHIV
jgi:hypothetical protein